MLFHTQLRWSVFLYPLQYLHITFQFLLHRAQLTPSALGKGTKGAIMKAIVPLTASSSSSHLETPLTSPASIPRKDMAIVHNYTRGDKRKVLTAAADDDLMAHAMSNYIQDWRSA